MSSKPLETLSKGLAKLVKSVKEKRDDLNTKLSKKITISAADEEWLDNEGNTVDEQHIFDTLKAATNYEKALEQLDESGKEIVKKLRLLGGDREVTTTQTKRKRVCFLSFE